MRTLSRLLLLPLLSLSIPAFAANWQVPTPEELQMTSQPEVPGADAVILNIEETASDREETASAFDIDSAGKRNFHSVYIRMKILTEAGRRYADVAIPNVGGLFSLGEVQGRTIQTDGSIVPLTAKPLIKNYEAVFAMPNVQVGSIIEYRYFLRYDGRLNIAPEWYIQRELFIRAGKYYFRVNGQDKINGRGEISGGAAYSSNLPKGTAVKYIRSENAFELVVHNVPPLPREEFMPPVQSLSYRVLFYYTDADTESDYWQSEGRSWAKDVDKFISSSKLKDAVSHLVSAGDSDQQKVAKIYQAVMKLENTSFTREHSAAENKAAGIRTKNADDIWEAKRGTADQITLLFVAMVRAAGLQAFSMDVTNRDRAVFVSSFLDKDQLDDEIAIVRIDGKEQFFDPGQRYCAFGQLHWKHTVTQGLREMNGITAIAKTPSASAAQAQTSRVANLDLDPDGKVHGFVRITMAGVPALEWRQRALSSDETEVNREFEQYVQSGLPPGVIVKTNHFVGLDDWNSALMVQLDVTGSLGTATAKRVLLPSSFFEAGSPPRFVHSNRETPVYLLYANEVQDSVTISLPKNFKVESLPKDANIPLPNNAVFTSKYAVNDNEYTLKRLLVLANFYFEPGDYPGLKDFYQKLNAQDQEQVVLTASAGGTGQ